MPLPLTSLVRSVSPTLSLSSSARVAPTTSVVAVAREVLAPSSPAPAIVVKVPLANAAISSGPTPVQTTAAPSLDPVPDVRPPVSSFRAELSVAPAASRAAAPASSAASMPMVAPPAPSPAGGGGTAADPLDLLPGRGAPDAAARELAPREPGPRRSDLLLVGVILAAGGALLWWSRGLARS